MDLLNPGMEFYRLTKAKDENFSRTRPPTHTFIWRSRQSALRDVTDRARSVTKDEP